MAKGIYSLDQEFGKSNIEHNKYLTQGKVLVHEQQVGVNDAQLVKDVFFAQEAALISRKQKRIAYGLSTFGFIASIGAGTPLSVRAVMA